MDKRKNIIYGSVAGAIAAIVFVTVVTIVGDLYLPLKDWLKNTFSHHWIGKGILSAILFVAVTACYAAMMRRQEKTEQFLATLLIISMIIGTLALLGFFLFEFVY